MSFFESLDTYRKSFRRLASGLAARAHVLRARRMGALSAREVFAKIYETHHWGRGHSRSGTGSDLQQTAVIRAQLPVVLSELGAKTLLDIPCGDFFWMEKVDLGIDYIGADVVPDLIERNRQAYVRPGRTFVTLDLCQDKLPKVDLVFCRDCLVHLSFRDIEKAFFNLKQSSSMFLLTTTFIDRDRNFDIPTGAWRPLNLQLPPFNLPPPLHLINERCTEGDGSWGDKSLGLWRISDLVVSGQPTS